MNRSYSFVHKRNDGTKTGYVNETRDNLASDDAAIHHAIEVSRGMVSDGLFGYLQCKGYWDASGFSLTVPLHDIDSINDPYVVGAPEDETLSGYGVVMEVFSFLWPSPGNSNKIPQPLNFKVAFGVTVSCSRPRACMVSMTKGEGKIDVYHMGPSLRMMMKEFGVSETEARQIWDEVIKKLIMIKEIFS